jgi:hypothetical protein
MAASTTTPPASEAPAAPSTETQPEDQEDERSTANSDVSAQAAIATPFSGFLSTRNIWIAGVALAVAVVGLLLLRRRQPQTPSRISLITRSLDRE